MSKSQVRHSIIQELSRLNNEIDRRIVRGLPYGFQARRHRVLLAQLRRIEQASRPLGKLFSFFL